MSFTRIRAGRSALTVASLALAALASLTAHAAPWEDCDEERRLGRDLDVQGIRTVALETGAGILEVRGRPGLGQVEARGIACASSPGLLAKIRLEVARRDDVLVIETVLPSSMVGQARLDLTVELPAELDVRIRDSSGSLEVSEVANLELTDSAGSITLERIPGEVHIVSDSGGSIGISDVGVVLIDKDSSGSIDVARAASLHIERDSSGSISARDVVGDVYVGSDTSGSIEVSNVGGNFTVVRDTSGGVRHRNVAGVVQVDGER